MDSNLIAVITSIIAFSFSVFVFIRQQTLQNEDYLYQHKLSNYQEIIARCYEILTLQQQIVDDFHDAFKANKHDIQKTDEAAIAVDRSIDSFQDEVLAKSIFLPEAIEKKLEIFLDSLYADEIIYNQKEEDFVAANNILEDLENKIDDIITEMRLDLNIKKLHANLKRRTK